MFSIFKEDYSYPRGNRCIFSQISVRCTSLTNFGCICDAHMSKIFRMVAKNETIVTGTSKRYDTIQYYTDIVDTVLPFPYVFLNSKNEFDATMRPKINLQLLESNVQQFVNQLQMEANDKRKVIHILQGVIAGGALNVSSDVCNNIGAFNDFFTKSREATFNNIYKNVQIGILVTTDNGVETSFTVPMASMPKFYQLVLLYATANFHESSTNSTAKLLMTPNLILSDTLHAFKMINNSKESEIKLYKDGATISSPVVYCGLEVTENSKIEPFNKGSISVVTPLLDRLPGFCLDGSQ